MKIKIDMTESDIVRSMKNNKYSPMQICVAKHLKDDPSNIDVNYDSIVLWNDEINDYHSYKYCVEDIKNVKDFLDEWNDYADGNLTDFSLMPISFCIEQKR